MDRTERCIDGARTFLTSEQRMRLACAARNAYEQQRRVGLADGGFDAWRHRECFAAVARRGLTEMDQGCYGPAMKHFLALAGGSRRKPDWRAAGKAPQKDDADRARHKLMDATFEAADSFGGQAAAQAYARALLSRIHKTTLEQATARQIWQVFFTLRNRARTKASKMPLPCVGAAKTGNWASWQSKPQEGHFPAFSREATSVLPDSHAQTDVG